MKRSVYARTWELRRSSRRRRGRWTTSAPSTTTCTGRRSATSSAPPQPPAGQAPLEYFINQTHEGYCQHYAGAMALMLRMAGISRAWRPASRPAASPRARRPGSCATPTPTRGSRSGSTSTAGSRSTRLPTRRPRVRRSPRSRRSGAPAAAPAADTGAADAAANTEKPNISVRPELRLGSRRADLGHNGRERRASLWIWALGAARVARRRARGAALPAPPARKTPMDRAINEVENALSGWAGR